MVRNARIYRSFLLSSIWMVMIFFLYNVLIYHPCVQVSSLRTEVQQGMKVASSVVYVFSFFFILNSMSAFLKSRSKEFGVLTVIGVEQRQLCRLISLETLILGSTSIVVGVSAGTLFSKLFLLACERLIHTAQLSFYWPVKACFVTVTSFSLLFTCVAVYMLFVIHRHVALHLLMGADKPRPEPKTSIWLCTLCLALLITGFVQVQHMLQNSGIAILTAAITGIWGTYLFYTQLLVYLLRWLHRRRFYTWMGTRLLWVGELRYKIKDTARMLFLVTVSISLASMFVSLILIVLQNAEQKFKQQPFPFSVTVCDENKKTNHQKNERQQLEVELHEAGVTYTQVSCHLLTFHYYEGTTRGLINIIKQTTFNRLAPLLQVRKVELTGKEARYIYTMKDRVNTISHKVHLVKGDLLSLRNNAPIFLPLSQIDQYSGGILVVNDAEFKRLSRSKGKRHETNICLYSIPEWGLNLPKATDPEALINEKLQQQNLFKNYNGIPRYVDYMFYKQTASTVLFIGGFIAIVFSLCAASFLYCKLYTDLGMDAKRYSMLSKIGLQYKEMQSIVGSQLLILFYFPILVSFLQTCVVIVPVVTFFYDQGLDSSVDPFSSIFKVTGSFLLLQTVFLAFVRFRYMTDLKKNMV